MPLNIIQDDENFFSLGDHGSPEEREGLRKKGGEVEYTTVEETRAFVRDIMRFFDGIEDSTSPQGRLATRLAETVTRQRLDGDTEDHPDRDLFYPLASDYEKRYPRCLRVCGYRFTTGFDLSDLTLPFSLIFDDCIFEQHVLLMRLKGCSLQFLNCRMEGVLNARRIDLQGDFLLDRSMIAQGLILHLGHINGVLQARYTRFAPKGVGQFRDGADGPTSSLRLYGTDGQMALNMVNARIAGAVDLEKMEAGGPVVFDHAFIGRHLDMRGASIGIKALGREHAVNEPNLIRELTQSISLKATALRLMGNLNLSQVTCVGQMRAPYAHISGSIFLKGAKFRCSDKSRPGDLTRGRAINMDKCTIEGDVSIPAADATANRFAVIESVRDVEPDDRMTVEGAWRMRHSVIKGHLYLIGLTIDSKGYTDTQALRLDGTTVLGYLRLLYSDITGGLFAPNLSVGRPLHIAFSTVRAKKDQTQAGQILEGSSSRSLKDIDSQPLVNFNHSHAKVDIVIADSTFVGSFSLADSVIDGDLIVKGSTFYPNTDFAFSAARVRINANMSLERYEPGGPERKSTRALYKEVLSETARGSGLNVFLGRLVLVDAEILGSLTLSHAAIRADQRYLDYIEKHEEETPTDIDFYDRLDAAIYAQGLSLKRNLHIGSKFESRGALNFTQCTIEDNVRIFDAYLERTALDYHPLAGVVLAFDRARIKGDFRLGSNREPLHRAPGETWALREQILTHCAKPDCNPDQYPRRVSVYCHGRTSLFGATIEGFLRLQSLFIDILHEAPSSLARDQRPPRQRAYRHLALNFRLLTVGKDLYTEVPDPRSAMNMIADGGDETDISRSRVEIHGSVYLEDARVRGNLSISNFSIPRIEVFRVNHPRAIAANGLRVENAVRFGPEVEIHGQLDLKRAEVGTYLEFKGIKLRHGPGLQRAILDDLGAKDIDIGQILGTAKKKKATQGSDALRLAESALGKRLRRSHGASARSPSDRSQEKQSVRLPLGALTCENITVGIKITLDDVDVLGPVNFSQASVRGNVEIRDASLHYDGRVGLDPKALGGHPLDDQTAEFCNDPLECLWIDYNGVRLGANGLPCLDLSASVITRDLIMNERARFLGDLEIGSAEVGDDLEFHSGSMQARPGKHHPQEARFERIEVDGEFSWGHSLSGATAVENRAANGSLKDGAQPECAGDHDFLMNLRGAKVVDFNDRKNDWPKAGNLIITGLSYEGMTDTIGVQCRKDWLELQKVDQPGKSPFPSQPYDQLISVYEKAGSFKEAEVIDIARIENSLLTAAATEKAWRNFLGVIIRHGYAPGRIIGVLIAFWALGIVAFGSAYQYTFAGPYPWAKPPVITLIEYEDRASSPNAEPMKRDITIRCMIPSEESADRDLVFAETPWARDAIARIDSVARQSIESPIEIEMPASRRIGSTLAGLDPSYPKFDAIFYALDVLTPVISLQQQNYWMPASYDICRFKWSGVSFNPYRSLQWLMILVGWLITSILVAFLTGIIKIRRR